MYDVLSEHYDPFATTGESALPRMESQGRVCLQLFTTDNIAQEETVGGFFFLREKIK